MKKYKRKVNLVGSGTLTISLPSEFVSLAGIQKGDELDISFSDVSILFTKDSKLKNEFTLDINNLNNLCLAKMIAILYRVGYSKIILTYSNDTIYNPLTMKDVDLHSEVVNIVKKNFIGVEIISHTKNQIEIECFTEAKDDDVVKVEHKVLNLFKDCVHSIFENFDKLSPQMYHAKITKKTETTTRFLNYFLRLICLFEKREFKKFLTYSLYLEFEFLLSKVNQISENVSSVKYSNDTKEMLKESLTCFLKVYEASVYNEIGHSHITNMCKAVQTLKGAKINNTEEMRLLHDVKSFVERAHKFCEYHLSKSYL